ncbi:MAG: ATP-grasp domain-containing protein [Patescibacteria group bacterium]
MHKKRILFCGNGLSCEIIKTLKDSYEIFMISDFSNDIGIEYVDKLIIAESKNPEAALKAAIELSEQGYTFDAVLSLCWDSGMSVSKIAEHFGLPSVPFDVSYRSTIKSLRSKIFEDNNIPAPKYKLSTSKNDFLSKIKEIGLPVVLKPVNLSSSKGVILLEKMSELENAYNYCTGFAKSQDVIINEYIEGVEYSTEGLMVKGKYYMTGISERVFHYQKCKPLFVEIGDIMPTLLSEDEISKFSEVTEKAALALGITDGVAKGDLIYTNKKEIKVFEITPRLGGPRFGTEMIPLSNGTDILRAAIQQALGEEINMDYLKIKFNRGMVNWSIFPNPGKIKSVRGLDEIKNMPGYYDFKWWGVRTLRIGDIIPKPENMCGGVGYIIATGQNREEAILNANNIEKKIIIETE